MSNRAFNIVPESYEVELVTAEGDEAMIAYMARVSNPSNQNNTETSARLIRYLIKHKHWSPFEMVHMTLKIVTSRAIAAQILRHRSFSFQEFSQRYAQPDTFMVPELRLKGSTNRQSSTEPIQDTHLRDQLNREVEALFKHIEHVHGVLRKCGVANECLRGILPLNTQTTLYMTGSLRSWLHYIDLRTKEDTQLEHRNIALKAQEILGRRFPTVYEAMWSHDDD